jgi:hypothetical protein
MSETDKLKATADAAGRDERIVICNHTSTQGRDGEKGSWCVDCGEKVYEVDKRECKDCEHFFSRPLNYSGCRKHLMAVTPDMHVTFKITDGTCWESR